jgi:alpha-amylase
MNIKKKILSAVLALSMVASVAVSTVSAATVKEETSVSANYGLAEEVQDGNILHCFDWKYNDIKAELKNIAEAGFTSIQTSPVQPHDTTGTWYWAYLPLGFYVGSNEFGTKAELQSLCEEADKYGIKVVVDVVANHLSGDHSKIQNDLKDGQYWHTYGTVSNWGDRYQVTNGEIGMPDLNTGDKKVQNMILNLMKECVDNGADGFRFDAAKHIETPADDASIRSDFWNVVLDGTTAHAQSTKGFTPYYYGEILNRIDSTAAENYYLSKMSVTDNSTGDNVRNSLRYGGVGGASNTGYAGYAHGQRSEERV